MPAYPPALRKNKSKVGQTVVAVVDSLNLSVRWRRFYFWPKLFVLPYTYGIYAFEKLYLVALADTWGKLVEASTPDKIGLN